MELADHWKKEAERQAKFAKVRQKAHSLFLSWTVIKLSAAKFHYRSAAHNSVGVAARPYP